MARRRRLITDDSVRRVAELMQMLNDQAAHRRALDHVCRPPLEVDVRAIRAVTGLSRACFGNRFGLSARVVQDWEQGRRRPDTAARTLLALIATEPEAIDRALAVHGAVRHPARRWEASAAA